MKKLILFMVLSMISSLAFADEIKLKNGSVIEGNISSVTTEEVSIYVVIDCQPANCLMRIPRREIQEYTDNAEFSQITFRELTEIEREQNRLLAQKRDEEVKAWTREETAHKRQIELERAHFDTILEKEMLLAREQRQSVNIGVEVNNAIDASSGAVITRRHKQTIN